MTRLHFLLRRPVLAIAALVGSSLVAPNASAFCGFYVAPGDAPVYNDASMVSLMREGTRTVLAMSNNYKGPPASFAMVVPVPVVLRKEDVRTLPLGIFKRLETLSAPRLVEYWEQEPCIPEADSTEEQSGGTGTKHKGAEGMMGDPSKTLKDYGVKIEAEFVAGEYEIVILGAAESDGLERWLRDNKYSIPAGAAAALAPYIAEQQKFFVARVDVSKVQKDTSGAVVLSPLRFSYEAETFRLPVRLGLINAQGKQDLLIYLLSKEHRFDVANYPNVFIPTNVDVADETRNVFGAFYAALFDATIAKAGGRAVVTEYAWDTASCDPCPSPPLQDSDLALLGGEVLFGMHAPDPKKPDEGPVNGFGPSPRMVMTRLHTRYDKSTLSDDLIFRIAPPIAGGREMRVDPTIGAIEQGSVPDKVNNFQARYAIRHPWAGPILCADPERGHWGDPPGNQAAQQTMPAKDLAAAARGTVSLEALVKSHVPELGLHRFAGPAGVAPGWRARYWRSLLVYTVLPLVLSVAALIVARRRRTAVTTG